MPSTTIPNDQEATRTKLYKIPGKTCEEEVATSFPEPMVASCPGSMLSVNAVRLLEAEF
jgi:hypothetical protein